MSEATGIDPPIEGSLVIGASREERAWYLATEDRLMCYHRALASEEKMLRSIGDDQAAQLLSAALWDLGAAIVEVTRALAHLRAS